MATRIFRTVSLAAALAGGYCVTYDVYKGPMGSLIRKLDGESAHMLGLRIARWDILRPEGIFPRQEDETLKVYLWGMTLSSPLGLAAGFDKDAVAVKGLLNMGFSAVEVGSVTPEPQPGNPKPRVFRLEEDRAVINRYGFNSAGIQTVRDNLIRYDYGGNKAGSMGIVGVNLGKNKDTPEKEAVKDYVLGVQDLGDLADYVVINVSSPNTPGLRDLQGCERLRSIVNAVLSARDRLVYKPPVLIKIAPDLSDSALADIVKVSLELEVDGIVVSNTTTSRPEGLQSVHRDEVGGLSGRPLKSLSTEVLRKVYQLTGGRIPLVGVGGVENGQDAYEKIRAGASFVQLYTALIYDGPFVIPRIKKELSALLKQDGFKSVAEAVGADHRECQP